MSRLPVVDFHTHVLPKMDDGSKSREMSLEMLRQIRAEGVDMVVATSHYYHRHEGIESFLDRRQGSFNRLSEGLENDCAGVIPGAEVAFFFGIEEEPGLEKLCIGNTRVLLLEMPFQSWGVYEKNAVSALCFERKLTVILAHYERFAEFQKKNAIYEDLLSLPVYVQINAESLLHGFASRRWIQMFRDGRAHLLGSDCHNLTGRPPNLSEGRKVLAAKLGTGVLEKVDRLGAELLLSGSHKGARI